MQRMAGRVKSLTSDAMAGDDATGGSWEDTVVRRLQRRMQELESKK